MARTEKQQADMERMLRDCLDSPLVSNSITFRRFLVLLKQIDRKLEAGEDVDEERAEMLALHPAIRVEMEEATGKVSRRPQ